MVTKTCAKIGERVKEYRKNRGLSQDELADGICSRQTISLLENGQHFPSVEFMQKIADRLSIALHEVLIDEARELEAKIQLDIVKVYIERGEYFQALSMIADLEQRDDLLEYQKRELVLCKAESLMRTGKSGTALEILKELQEKLEGRRETDDLFMATLFNKIGSAYHLSSNMVYAHTYYVRAYQLISRFAEFDLLGAFVSYNLGNACVWLGFYSDAIMYFERAQEYYAKVQDDKRLADTLFIIGNSYNNMKLYDQAEKYLLQAQALYKAKNITIMAQRVKQQHAAYVLSEREPDKAIADLVECAQEFEKAGDVVRVSYGYASAAGVCLNNKNLPLAGEYLEIAMNAFTEEMAKTDPRYPYVYRVYARYLQETKEFEKSVQFAFKSHELFDKMGLEKEAADSLQHAVDSYRAQGRYEEAVQVYQVIVDGLRRSQVSKS